MIVSPQHVRGRRIVRLELTRATRDVVTLLLIGWAVFTIYNSPNRRRT